MQAETHGIIVLPSGHLMRSREHAASTTYSFGREIGIALGLILALVAVMAVVVATSAPAPASSDARRSIAPGTAQPVADPHGVRPSLLQTAG